MCPSFVTANFVFLLSLFRLEKRRREILYYYKSEYSEMLIPQ